MEVAVTGVKAVINLLKKKQKAVDRRIEQAGKLAGATAVREIKLQIRGSHKRGTKTPSKHGEPPTNISGDLRRSIKYNSKRKGFASYEVIAGPTMIYGRAVELGQSRWGAGVNYPYVKPAAKLLTENGKLLEIYERAVREGLNAV